MDRDVHAEAQLGSLRQNIHFAKAPRCCGARMHSGWQHAPTYDNLQRKKGAEAVMTTRLCGHSTKQGMDG